jgi:uncharacterized protein YgiB involved in biofilm formation
MSEDPATDRAAPPGAPSKRSQTVSLVLVAGAAATALGLGHLDPSQSEESVLVYASADACAAEAIRAAAECREAYGVARAAYPTAAPRYDGLAACEGHHGAGHCVPGETVAPDASGRYLPRMAGYMIGRSADQNIVPQPVFEHRPGTGGHAGHGGYCMGSGARVYAGGGHASSARVASSAVARTSFGGFGGTGRGFAAHAASAGG